MYKYLYETNNVVNDIINGKTLEEGKNPKDFMDLLDASDVGDWANELPFDEVDEDGETMYRLKAGDAKSLAKTYDAFSGDNKRQEKEVVRAITKKVQDMVKKAAKANKAKPKGFKVSVKPSGDGWELEVKLNSERLEKDILYWANNEVDIAGIGDIELQALLDQDSPFYDSGFEDMYLENDKATAHAELAHTWDESEEYMDTESWVEQQLAPKE